MNKRQAKRVVAFRVALVLESLQGDWTFLDTDDDGSPRSAADRDRLSQSVQELINELKSRGRG